MAETSRPLPTPQTQPAAQLLVDMPAESAARLLTLSLLEQLSMHALPPAAHSSGPSGSTDDVSARRLDAHRSALSRLRGCIALYKDVLGDSVSPKMRRWLRDLTTAAIDLHDVEATRAWLAATEPSPHVTLTAEWIRDRLAGRRAKALERFAQLQANPKPFRRLAKRLGVYTTAVRLEDISTSFSFGELTRQRLLRVADLLRAGVFTIGNGDDSATLRRVERAAEQLVYLLEPVGSRGDAERLATTARELRSSLTRMRSVTMVGEALVQAGRRIGARQMMARTYDVIWPPSEIPEGHARSPKRFADGLPNDLGFGLTVLAERARDESARAFGEFASRWPAGEIDVLMVDISAIATELRDR